MERRNFTTREIYNQLVSYIQNNYLLLEITSLQSHNEYTCSHYIVNKSNDMRFHIFIHACGIYSAVNEINLIIYNHDIPTKENILIYDYRINQIDTMNNIINRIFSILFPITTKSAIEYI